MRPQLLLTTHSPKRFWPMAMPYSRKRSFSGSTRSKRTHRVHFGSEGGWWLVASNRGTSEHRYLSLRFNHKGFATDVKLIAKLLAFAIFTVSGSRFDGRVAFRSARKAAFGPPGGPTAGFRRLRWRAQLRQKRRNYPMDPHRCQSTGVVASLPRQPQVRNAGARQP